MKLTYSFKYIKTDMVLFEEKRKRLLQAVQNQKAIFPYDIWKELNKNTFPIQPGY